MYKVREEYLNKVVVNKDGHKFKLTPYLLQETLERYRDIIGDRYISFESKPKDEKLCECGNPLKDRRYKKCEECKEEE